MPARLRLRQSRTPEGVLVLQVLQLLRACGITAWRNNTAGIRRRDRHGREFWAFHGLRGASDVFALLPGKFVALECKVLGGRLTAEQADFLERVRSLGHVGVVVHSVDELVEVLRREGIG